jgi:hypothetical protein
MVPGLDVMRVEGGQVTMRRAAMAQYWSPPAFLPYLKEKLREPAHQKEGAGVVCDRSIKRQARQLGGPTLGLSPLVAAQRQEQWATIGH